MLLPGSLKINNQQQLGVHTAASYRPVGSGECLFRFSSSLHFPLGKLERLLLIPFWVKNAFLSPTFSYWKAIVISFMSRLILCTRAMCTCIVNELALV